MRDVDSRDAEHFGDFGYVVRRIGQKANDFQPLGCSKRGEEFRTVLGLERVFLRHVVSPAYGVCTSLVNSTNIVAH